jgi:hypothetical protein
MSSGRATPRTRPSGKNLYRYPESAGCLVLLTLTPTQLEGQFSGESLPYLPILDEETTVEEEAVAAAQSSFDVSNQHYKGGVTSTSKS